MILLPLVVVQHIHLHAEAWVAIAAWLTLVVLGISAVFAAVQVRDARSLREEEARPVVVVDLDIDKRPHMIFLYFQNLGKTTAHDVRLTFTPRLQSTVAGGKYVTFFDHTFPTLPPGKRIDSFFDSAIARLAEPPPLPTSYDATVEYRDRLGRLHSDDYHLDIEAFRGRMSVPERGVEEIAAALEEIDKHLKDFRSTYGGIRAVIQSQDDAEKARDELYASIKPPVITPTEVDGVPEVTLPEVTPDSSDTITSRLRRRMHRRNLS
jgi:hypothetical protein